MFKVKFVLSVSLLIFFSLNVYCQSSDGIVLKKGLVIKLGRSNIENVISPDPVVASMVTGKWKTPSDNEKDKK